MSSSSDTGLAPAKTRAAAMWQCWQRAGTAHCQTSSAAFGHFIAVGLHPDRDAQQAQGSRLQRQELQEDGNAACGSSRGELAFKHAEFSTGKDKQLAQGSEQSTGWGQQGSDTGNGLWQHSLQGLSPTVIEATQPCLGLFCQADKASSRHRGETYRGMSSSSHMAILVRGAGKVNWAFCKRSLQVEQSL